MRLDGRTALVAGASSGIGRAGALGFARAGAHVVAVARRRPELDALRAEIERGGGTAEAAVCDVTDPGAVAGLFARLERVDVLLASVGGNRPKPLGEVTEDDLEWTWAINVAAPFRLAQATARLALARGTPASIVLLSSQMGHVGSPRRTAYCTAKHAVEGMVKAMAVELAPHGIRVNALAPTFVRTPMTEPFFADPQFGAWVEERIPLGGALEPGQLLGALLLLASDAGSGITGTSLLVDGGWTAQ